MDAELLREWPFCGGEMAARIRGFDWSATLLGPSEGWPQSLLTTVDLLLPSGFGMVALWGPQLLQIYNDAYRDLMGAKHPLGLGQPTQACWPEVWHINEPIYGRVRAGETLIYKDALYPITRSGSLEQAWFTLTYSPLRSESGEVAGILVTVFETTRQHLTEAALRDGEERFRAFVTASSDVVYRMSPDWTEMRRLEGRAFLRDTDEPSRAWVDRYIHPDDQATVHAAIEQAIATKSVFELEHPVIRADGTLGWTFSRAVPILTDAGEIREWLGTATDVTARRKTESSLRESERRLGEFGEASSDVLWMRDTATFQWVYLTPAFETIYGLDRAAALSGDNLDGWIDLIVPEDRELALASLRRVMAGERVTFEYRVRRPLDGEIRWLRDTDFPMHDAAGEVRWIGGVGRDITEEKETAAHLGVLVAELQHRTRNLMGVVRAMADKTQNNSADLGDFKERFGTRLAALARVQGLLSRLAEGERITFDDLIQGEMAALNGEASRVSFDGPKGVALRSSSVQTFAMALHELSTNALKYGALAQPQGHLSIRWRVERAEKDSRPWLHVDWRERGVLLPAKHGTPPGGGSGRELIERALPYQLGARTTYVMEADGVHCTVALPVSERHIEREMANA